MYEVGRDIHTSVLRSEKGCRIRVTHVHACSDCVHTRDDTDRLNYASQLVRVIYSSHIVSNHAWYRDTMVQRTPKKNVRCTPTTRT